MPIKKNPNVFGLATKTSEHIETAPAKKQMIELRKILLNEKGDDVVKKLLEIALNDEHPQQMTAITKVIDRILPMSEFEKLGSLSRPSVVINISGISEPVTISGEEVEN